MAKSPRRAALTNVEAAKKKRSNRRPAGGKRSPAARPRRRVMTAAVAKKIAQELEATSSVPLCATHHHEVHTTGDERGWWARHKIEPLTFARQLWEVTAGKAVSVRSDAAE